MKIYLIDDDPNILNILKIIIQTRGRSAVCAAPLWTLWRT